MCSCKLVGHECQVIHHLDMEMEQIVDRIHQKVTVFEIGEQQQVHANTHYHPEPFPSGSLCTMDQVPQVEIRHRRKEQDEKKESGCFPVKEDTGGKKEGIPGCTLPVDPGIDQQDQHVESPEKESGEDHRIFRVVEEYVRKNLVHLPDL